MYKFLLRFKLDNNKYSLWLLIYSKDHVKLRLWIYFIIFILLSFNECQQFFLNYCLISYHVELNSNYSHRYDDSGHIHIFQHSQDHNLVHCIQRNNWSQKIRQGTLHSINNNAMHSLSTIHLHYDYTTKKSL